MSVKNNLKIIEEILSLLDDRGDKTLQAMHDLGYLMGLLARLANNDSFVYAALRAELERLRKKQ